MVKSRHSNRPQIYKVRLETLGSKVQETKIVQVRVKEKAQMIAKTLNRASDASEGPWKRSLTETLRCDNNPHQLHFEPGNDEELI